MTQLPDLIRDLGFILVTAATVTIIFKRLHQPLVLGYLIAGFFLGPHFPFFIGIEDPQSIHIWAEIGVIFLLFGLGLEFSFKKLSRVGKSAGLTAIIESTFMLAVGFVTGKFIGWNNLDSLYLGGILSISSTTIIVKAFDELGLKGKKFVSLVYGILIVEDLIAILILVLLSTAAVTKTLSGTMLASATFKFAFFLTIWFLIGIYIIPIILKKIKKQLTPETTIVVSLGLCLLMVIIATDAGFSAPLGAFIMGSILAETKEGKNIEHLINPIKDLFSAVFFVSVGMMINPESLVQYWDIILIISMITICGKIFSTCLGAIFSGQSLKTSLYAGMSLAQIGEFSFIIATLGLTLKVTGPFLYPIAVAVSAITTFTTPYLIKSSGFFYDIIDKKLPQNIKDQLIDYENAFNTKTERNVLSLLWEAYGIRILLNITVVVAITLFTEFVILFYLRSYDFTVSVLSGIGALMAIIFSIPFLWAIIYGSPSIASVSDTGNVARLKNLLLGVTIARVTIGVFLLLAIISRFTDMHAAYFYAFFTLLLIVFFLKKRIDPFYQSIEKKFMDNLNEKEREEIAKQKDKPTLAPWDVAMAEFFVSPDSSIVGKTLQDSALKDNLGVTIALIERGSKKIMAPGRDTILMSYDLLYLIGNENQLIEAKKIIEFKGISEESIEQKTYGLESILLSIHSPYIKKSIRDCGLREKIEGLIVGIERENLRILNPDPSLVLEVGDLLWVVADPKNLQYDV